jgi:hypothetical protein
VTPLTDDEKRTIASRYRRLRTAIDGGYAEDDVTALAAAFQQAYHGAARPIVDAFGAADDKREWARQVESQVAPEIGVEFWPVAGHPLIDPSPPVTDSVVIPDDVVALPVTCDDCGESFEVQCAPPDVAAMVTEHTFACPVCRRLIARELPGAIVDVVSRREGLPH